jgi:hypothetical protein
LTVLTEDQSFFWTVYQILSYPAVWLCFLLSSVVSVIPDLLIKIVENTISDYNQSTELKRVRSFDKVSQEVPKLKKEQSRKRDCNKTFS